jgi:hypothetical protein
MINQIESLVGQQLDNYVLNQVYVLIDVLFQSVKIIMIHQMKKHNHFNQDGQIKQTKKKNIVHQF